MPKLPENRDVLEKSSTIVIVTPLPLYPAAHAAPTSGLIHPGVRACVRAAGIVALTQMDGPPWHSAAISSALGASCADAIDADSMAKAMAIPKFKCLAGMFLLRSNTKLRAIANRG